MEVYIDKLPESCDKCPCLNVGEESQDLCKLTNEELKYWEGKIVYKPTCPLKLISEVKKQERERVLDLVREKYRVSNIISGDDNNLVFLDNLDKIEEDTSND